MVSSSAAGIGWPRRGALGAGEGNRQATSGRSPCCGRPAASDSTLPEAGNRKSRYGRDA